MPGLAGLFSVWLHAARGGIYRKHYAAATMFDTFCHAPGVMFFLGYPFLRFLHLGAEMAQAPLTTFHILRAWAAALKSDRTLDAWAQQHFQKSFALWIGADMRRPPEEADAPFIALFPDQCQTGKERTANRHELGLVIGLADEVMAEVDGVQEMRGLLRLDEVWPRVQAALDMALPDAVPQEPTVEYELAQYPLVMLLVTVIVEQRLPIGGRIGGPIFGPRQQKSGGA